MSKRLRIGVIGAGRIGKIHAESVATRLPQAELAAVADIYLPAAQELGKAFQAPVIVADYHVILADPAIDAVAICSDANTHAEIIQEAAAAGKHIFCEKPIDYSLAKIDAALTAVAQANVKLQIGFNRRFDPNFRKVRQMIVDGKIGQPHILHITSRDPAPPPIEYIKVSGGIFLDMTIHDFDMARYLIGSQVTEIYALGGVMIDPAIGEAGDLDTVVITLKFANGVIGTIDNSRQAVYGYDQRVEVFGSEGMVSVANNMPDTHVHSDANGVHSSLPLHFFLERYLDSYVIEMQEFVDVVLHDKEPPVKGADGRIAVVMGLAAQESWQENHPVSLNA